MNGVDGDRGTPASAPGLRSDAQRNEQALLRAATAAVHRAGWHVPLATIASDAGVGIATLYRHFPSREHLLVRLTHRSFEQVLLNAGQAESAGADSADSLRRFISAAIDQRNELVLPLHGGPPLTAPATLAVQAEVHLILRRILDRGREDGSLKPGLTPRDVFVFGAMLAQPHPPDTAWDATCRRLLAHYVDGLLARPCAD